MSTHTLRTVVLGLVLALIVVPMGGPYTVVGLLLVLLLVVLDLLWERRRQDRAARVPVAGIAVSDASGVAPGDLIDVDGHTYRVTRVIPREQ